MSKIRDYINEKYPVREAYFMAFHSTAPLGNCYCPFHPNKETPSAKVYDFGLKCFGECNRVYSSYDIIKTFAPEIIDEIAGSSVIKVTKKEVERVMNEEFIPGQDVVASIITYLDESTEPADPSFED